MLSLAALADILGGACIGDGTRVVSKIAPLESAGPADLVFVLEPKYAQAVAVGRCVAAVVSEVLSVDLPQIVVSNPRLALAKALEILYPSEPHQPGCHVSAVIDAGAVLGPGVSIGPFSVVSEGVFLGADTVIADRVSVGKNCRIGEGCYLYPGVVLYPGTVLGNRVVVHAGAVLGADGFGYVQDGAAIRKMPHIGRVVIGNHVEIGANCTIDRGCLGDTCIDDGVKLDNLVHVSHNTHIGAGTMVAAQSGFVGSARVGVGVQIGGQVGVSRVTIGDYSVVAAKSGVTKDIDPKKMVSGFPAWDHMEEIRKEAYLRRLYKQSKEHV